MSDLFSCPCNIVLAFNSIICVCNYEVMNIEIMDLKRYNQPSISKTYLTGIMGKNKNK